MLPLTYKERIQSITIYEEDASSTGRLELWATGFKMIRDHPLTGVSLNSFSSFVEIYNPNIPFYARGLVAHKAYIELAAETGIITFFFYVLLIIISLIRFI